MASHNKTIQNNAPVDDFIGSLNNKQTIADTKQLIQIMHKITGHPPKMWGAGIVGFDSYHYKYASGREGDCQPIGFRPGNGKITIYLIDGTARYVDLLARLGKHTSTKACLHIKSLNDINLVVLQEIIKKSYHNLLGEAGVSE